MGWANIELYRREYDVTRPGDTVERFELGINLRARLFGIPIPIGFAVWWRGLDIKL